MRVYYFGCWNSPGHYLHSPGGRSHFDPRVAKYGNGIHVDGSLAPRIMRRTFKKRDGSWILSGARCWLGEGATPDEASAIDYASVEMPQGFYLHHHLDNGYTAVQWWDRCQGDKRGGCNSTILLEGRHDAPEMLAALREHFPHVLANLERGGVELVEVPRPPAETRC